MKQLGYGHEYRYAHNEPHAYAAGEHYLPEGMKKPNWYQPVPRGLEIKIAEKMAFLKNLMKNINPSSSSNLTAFRRDLIEITGLTRVIGMYKVENTH